MKKIMPIYGTRPEAIKMAPIIKALQEADDFQPVVTVTGQHREMLDQVNELFQITPDYDLNIIQPRQTLNGVLTRTVNGLDELLVKEKPDAVIVQGDTTAALGGAIAAFYAGISVIHVEAGLRSFNLFSPFPEEANRKMISQVTSLHLAPTVGSKANLTREGVDSKDIAVTGNTVIDALLDVAQQDVPFADKALEEAAASGRDIHLVTTHRRENQGSAMEGVGRALARLAERYPNTLIVLPAHRNPVVREAILPSLEGHENVIVTEPLPYGEFTRLMNLSKVVLTDSGGVQEEAPSLGKPVLVMRENTERPEAVEAGTVRLIGTDEERVVQEVSELFDDAAAYESMSNAVNPYGDGQAASRTLAAMRELFGTGSRMPDFSTGN
ncbi:UDP-N-acetylglucosamine 2-epimerase (non-hydrolyzing) [Nesterenkonia massiliensis]|uniref:UDP-N-acetylglucosamine 2-epimerase (non-hydrolyzing) n=1 Tax=Nesterenkonia massiliensis TaxID=1232429 RepID=A0ABT2HML0_9MICC|nr:UDP-N-acetylglucosamine 2-epimerase (non-hydrolyzing) [Nesterenkonia massiliensis]MCT1605921.1 UDP-N-acetylglucosamine 2-epimerase (non-hydrolyzing) [Nesterenkonia massiliensis]